MKKEEFINEKVFEFNASYHLSQLEKNYLTMILDEVYDEAFMNGFELCKQQQS